MSDERDVQIQAYWEAYNTTSMNDKFVATLETEMLGRFRYGFFKASSCLPTTRSTRVSLAWRW